MPGEQRVGASPHLGSSGCPHPKSRCAHRFPTPDFYWISAVPLDRVPPLNEKASLPRPDRDRTLLEVIEEFGERVRPGGSHGEIDEWSIYDESFRRLQRWAQENGCYFPDLQPLKEGGREHDLTFDPVSSSWLKFTKPSAAGYVVSFDFGHPDLRPALPLEYLERLNLQNRIFADDVSFVGIAGAKHDFRIVTRQSDIPGGAATDPEIIQLMTGELGFTLLPRKFSVGYAESLAFLREDVAVFDLRAANVVKMENGLIVPIDSIPVRLDETARTILQD
jgi:hypothetical protein